MGKGRKGSRYRSVNPSAELAILQRAERDIQRRTLQRELAAATQQINKGGRKKTLIISGNDGTKIVYTKADQIPLFSVRQLLEAIKIQGIDMSSDLNPGVTIESMTVRLADNIDEDYTKFRIYMRDYINYANFAMLQHLVETMYLPRPLEELQGWIMHIGSIFVMGGVDFDLTESVDRCKQAINHLASEIYSRSTADSTSNDCQHESQNVVSTL